VYEEVSGHEVDLATDHDGSRILEKLFKLSDDFTLRVFFDKLSGRYVTGFTTAHEDLTINKMR
jgi:hypothetical protein